MDTGSSAAGFFTPTCSTEWLTLNVHTSISSSVHPTSTRAGIPRYSVYQIETSIDRNVQIVVKPGDWGRITQGRRGLAFWRKNGIFLKEGNIFLDGKAEKYGIPEPVECGGESEGETWVVSQNAKQVEVSASGCG